MAIQLQLRKGSKSDNDAFTGAEAELTYDTTTKGLRIHDGVTQGGHLVDVVVFFQAPTAENNYTWARKYASGWVEQGGLTGADSITINLPVEMADTNYEAFGNIIYSANEYAYTGQVHIASKTTTSFSFAASSSFNRQWHVMGMAA